MKPIVAVPATAALVYRVWSRKSLTPLGICVAAATAVAHAIHPWSVFFALLVVFFLTGTAVTKVKHDVKSRLTHSSTGCPGGEGPRTHIQVLANSLVASILIIIHTWLLREQPGSEECWPRGADVLVVGIVANYAAVAADTFSSELGILSSSEPRLITAPWRVVPKGTNGGVTLTGLGAGLLGAVIIALTSVVLLPFCSSSTTEGLMNKLIYGISGYYGWTLRAKVRWVVAITFAGFCGTLLDSLLGAVLQASVVDVHTGRIIEGDGGRKVPVHSSGSLHMKQRAMLRSELVNHEEGTEAVAKTSALSSEKADQKRASTAERARSIVPKEGNEKKESRRVAAGRDLLDNNGVNFLMAAIISVASMVVTGWMWELPVSSVWPSVTGKTLS